jgi:diguanylate cyclase (GGDEF)-like protein/PAS domain S-box-containing protein
LTLGDWDSVNQLSNFSGEFADPAREAEFQARRLPETLSHARVLLICSAVLNTLFLLSDWRFHGQPHFYIAVPSRCVVVLFSLVCLWLTRGVISFPGLQRVMLLWQAVTAVGVGLLVSSHSDIALFVVLMLPMIYFLVVPTRFRWTLISSGGCSLLLLAGYALPNPPEQTITGLLMAVLMFNSALAIAVRSANRLKRLEWSATQAEQDTREELARSRDTLEAIFKAVPVPLVVTSDRGTVVRVNQAAVDFFGSEKDAENVANVESVYAHPADRQFVLERLRAEQEINAFESQLRRADGSIRDVIISSRIANVEGAPHIISSAVDITDRKLVELHLAQLAMSDPLTGLANRSHFMTAADRAVRQVAETGGKIAVLLLDVDDFKQVNDSAGHDAGDALLRAVAVRLQASVRPGDVVARLGGDEFAVMLTGLHNEADLQTILDRILAKLAEPLIYAGRTVVCKASIGASLFPEHAEQVQDLMKCADIALYEAKTRGRGRACIFEPSMLVAWEQEAGMLFSAREAIASQEIVPFYQPKVDLLTGEVIGFEALLRWVRADGEIVMPSAISAAFENPDLAQAISNRMIGCVLRDIRGWLDQGLDIGHVAINLSGADLRSESFPEQLLSSLALANVPCRHIELEVTESVFLGRGAECVERTLRSLSLAGIRIALDDFGTGYASLSHLKQFPIDVIKIDQRFVRDLQDDPDDAAIVRAVLNLSYSLGIKTVAEGIETDAQAEYLKAGGCHFGQGYLFSPAVPAAQVAPLFDRISGWAPHRKVA